jgi:hypothetical protein
MRPSGASSNAVGFVSAFVISVSENPLGSVAARETSSAALRKKTNMALTKTARVRHSGDFVSDFNLRLLTIESSHPFPELIQGSFLIHLCAYEGAHERASGESRLNIF